MPKPKRLSKEFLTWRDEYLARFPSARRLATEEVAPRSHAELQYGAAQCGMSVQAVKEARRGLVKKGLLHESWIRES